MADEAKLGAGESGDDKTAPPRRHWGTWVIDKAISGIAGALFAAFVLGAGWATFNNQIERANATADEARGLAIAGQAAYRKFKEEVTKELSQQVLNIKNSVARRFGEQTKWFDERMDRIDRFTARADETMKWLRAQQERDSIRAREEWRDNLLRKR